MPKYFYTAQSLTGERKSGILEAKDEHQLARILREEGLILIRAELEEKKLPSTKFGWGVSRGPSLAEKIFFNQHVPVLFRVFVRNHHYTTY